MTDADRRRLVRAERTIDEVLDSDTLTQDEFDRLNKLFHDLDDLIGDVD